MGQFKRNILRNDNKVSWKSNQIFGVPDYYILTILYFNFDFFLISIFESAAIFSVEVMNSC